MATSYTELDKEWIIQTYHKVLNGEVKNFSPYFFQQEYRKHRLQVIFRHFIEDIMKIPPQEAYQKITVNDLKQYKLYKLLKYIDKPDEIDDNDLIYLFHFVYPELYPLPPLKELVISLYKKVLLGERKSFPKNYFTDPTYGEIRARYCLEYLVYDVLKLKTKEEIKEQLTVAVLKKYKLKILVDAVYLSIYDLLEDVFNIKF